MNYLVSVTVLSGGFWSGYMPKNQWASDRGGQSLALKKKIKQVIPL